MPRLQAQAATRKGRALTVGLFSLLAIMALASCDTMRGSSFDQEAAFKHRFQSTDHYGY